MADNVPAKKGFTPDWLVRGVLTKLGDTFDRLTGRGWKPSSSLATSELIERLKALLDAEARDERPGCKFVPNNIKLKMQWDKFSTDSDESLKKLEAELLTATVDHINDKRYFTHAPLSIEVRPDYFTPGVRLLVSFDKFADDDREAAIHLSVPGAGAEAEQDKSAPPHKVEHVFTASYSLNGNAKSRRFSLVHGRRISVGRTKENDLSIDDASVSKIHASLTVDESGSLIVADTGSTNGTYVAGERIAYGKAVIIGDGGSVKFGAVEVTFKSENIPMPAESFTAAENSEALQASGMPVEPAPSEVVELPAETQASIPLSEPAPTEPSIPVEQPAPTEPSIDLGGKQDS
jgi:pSer/pThr/pTyr-binding forkhead associated (FHA) protein